MTKRLISLFLLLLFATASACISSHADGFDWIHDYDRAVQLSKQKDRPIFAYLETDWCTYCRQMEASTLKDQALIEEVGNDFIWLKLNAEKDEAGIKLRDRFRISSYPGMLILDAKGREWDRFSGYIPSAEFQKKLQEATGPNSFRALLQRLDSNPDDAEAHFLMAERLRERERWRDAAEAYGKYLQSDSENALDRADQALYYRAVGLSMSSQVEDSLKTLKSLEAQYPTSRWIPDSVLLRGQLLKYLKRNQEAREAFETYLARYPDHGYSPQVREILSKMEGGSALPMARSH